MAMSIVLANLLKKVNHDELIELLRIIKEFDHTTGLAFEEALAPISMTPEDIGMSLALERVTMTMKKRSEHLNPTTDSELPDVFAIGFGLHLMISLLINRDRALSAGLEDMKIHVKRLEQEVKLLKNESKS